MLPAIPNRWLEGLFAEPTFGKWQKICGPLLMAYDVRYIHLQKLNKDFDNETK